MYCNRSCLWVCDSGRAGVRAVSESYYSQRARSFGVSLSAFFDINNNIIIVISQIELSAVITVITTFGF